MHGDNEIQRSSATNTTQNLLISRPLFISITPLPLSSWVGARRTLIWHQPPSVTNLNCCVMNYKAGAGAVELFCVTNIPWSLPGIVIDEWEETADRRCVFGATSNLSVWMVIRLKGLVLIPREKRVCLYYLQTLWVCHSNSAVRCFLITPCVCTCSALHSEDKQIGLNKLHHSLTAAQSGNLINDKIERAVVRRSWAN